MACGCPVITTTNGSLAEVAGDAAQFVREDDVPGMVDAMRQVQRPDEREKMVKAGLEQAGRFSWKRTADAIREVLLGVASGAVKT
jgi:glycosyltransferase involved in cell wall biosynthesis